MVLRWSLGIADLPSFLDTYWRIQAAGVKDQDFRRFFAFILAVMPLIYNLDDWISRLKMQYFTFLRDDGKFSP